MPARFLILATRRPHLQKEGGGVVAAHKKASLVPNGTGEIVWSCSVARAATGLKSCIVRVGKGLLTVVGFLGVCSDCPPSLDTRWSVRLVATAQKNGNQNEASIRA